ncbi:type VI secretion system-associated protein TagF [Rhizobium straminoryzae]|nr:type VI secretion system-associated protein TagF [Rhizobium straminoryzae]
MAMQDRSTRAIPTREADRIGFFGKLPTHGDFVGWGVPVELQRLLQDWLQQGLQLLHDRLGDAWSSAFKATPPWRFIVEEGLWSDPALAGVFLPSTDRVGRAFPLVIISQIHAATDHPFQLYKDESWFTAVEAIGESSLRRDFQLEDFTAALQKLRRLRPFDPPEEALNASRGRTRETLWWSVATASGIAEGFRRSGPPQAEDVLRLVPPHHMPAQGAVARRLEPKVHHDPTNAPLETKKERPLVQWRHAFHTHPGTRQRRNCDALLTSDTAGLFAVADGLGDTAGAAEAARLALHLAGQTVLNGPVEARLQEVKGKLGQANSLLRSRKAPSSETSADAASLVALVVDQHSFAVLWSGDSRCYLLRDGMLRCLTRDHIQIGMKRSLSRAVGLHPTFHCETAMEDLREKDCFLLCSAPLSRVLPERFIAGIMETETLSEVPRSLIENALVAGCPDNLSSLVVHVEPC